MKLKELKVGDRVKTLKDFSFDPAEGIIEEISPSGNLYKVRITKSKSKDKCIYEQTWNYWKDQIELLEKKRGGETMSIKKVKVGEIYAIKEDCKHKCGTFRGNDENRYIKITATNDGEELSRYDILNSKKEKIASCCACFKLEHLVKKGGVMRKLKTLARKLLDKDTRDLIKAGVLDESLQVEDQEFVLDFVVEKYKKEMAVEARASIKEAKEDK